MYLSTEDLTRRLRRFSHRVLPTMDLAGPACPFPGRTAHASTGGYGAAIQQALVTPTRSLLDYLAAERVS